MDPHFVWGTIEDGWRKGPWTPQEDKLLIEHVNQHGDGRWNFVSRLTGLKRSGKSCRLRWVNYLRPDLKRGKITPHEEAIILELHSLWGNRWSTIARNLPGRTDNEIKNYWRTHFKKTQPSKKVERARARLLRRQQQQEQQQQHAELQRHEADMKAMMRQLEDMEEMAYMYPMGCLFQGGGAAMSDDGSSEDGIWGSLWNLDDMPADGAMQQEQVFPFW